MPVCRMLPSSLPSAILASRRCNFPVHAHLDTQVTSSIAATSLYRLSARPVPAHSNILTALPVSRLSSRCPKHVCHRLA